MEIQKTELTSHKEPVRHSRTHLRAAMDSGAVVPATFSELPDPPADFTKYVFQLQGLVESQGFMDYHEYARRMWTDIVGPAINEGSENGFKIFENSLIASLHVIDMKDHLYPHVRENLQGLVERRGSQVNEVALWSTGDVGATG